MSELNCEQCETHLFDFHEGKLGRDLAARIDEHLRNCDACAALLKDIWQMSLVATRWQDESPITEVSTTKTGWVMPQLLATAASALALVLVLTDTHFVMNDDGFTLRVGRDGYVSEATLANFQQMQNADIESRLQRLSAQQLASNQLMMRTLLETSRTERRDDLQTLVSYWNTTQTEQMLATREDLEYLMMSQAEDDKDIQQLSDAFQSISMRRGNDL